jgi:WD40-like Beta Propeller Repeat
VVRSVHTGAVVRTLADNVGGIAISPDGATAFYQSGPAGQSAIYSVRVSGGTPVHVGSGSAPAVSPDSSKLAYALPGDSDVVAIYDVARRTIQAVDVSELIGTGYHLANTGSLLAWGQQHPPGSYPSRRCQLLLGDETGCRRQFRSAEGEHRHSATEGCGDRPCRRQVGSVVGDRFVRRSSRHRWSRYLPWDAVDCRPEDHRSVHGHSDLHDSDQECSRSERRNSPSPQSGRPPGSLLDARWPFYAASNSAGWRSCLPTVTGPVSAGQPTVGSDH